MAWIRDQVNVQAAAVLCLEHSRRSDVILHVSTAENAARIDVFKLGEDVGRSLVHDVDHDA